MTSRIFSRIAVVLLSWAPLGTGMARAQSEILQWNRWEEVLTSSRDYTQNGGNPYRDLVLQVTFIRETPPLQVTGYGFWDGDRTFKIRTALPPGTWRWTTSCTGTAGGEVCGRADGSGRDPGLWRSGSFRVLPYGRSAGVPEIYLRGFFRDAHPGSPFARHLVYGDGVTPFFWLGDTAWQASVSATEDQWERYLRNRRDKRFSVVLMAPATQYTGTITSFDPGGSCSTLQSPIPNAGSRWVPAYWRSVDEKVERSNRAGLVVVMAGLINPVGCGGAPTPTLYPAVGDAAIFARNLAARLSGNFVIFSPGFDDKITVAVAGGPATVRDSMEATGRELERVVPRHLVGDHLAGSTPPSDYGKLQGQSWLDLQLFQSGHAFNLSACPAGETRQQCAVQRARELPLELRGMCPAKPAVNAEGGYEYPLDSSAQPPDNRYGVRQTAYYSTLSGAFGFTLGVDGIYDWTDPLNREVLDSPSSFDMTYLASRFRNRPWQEMMPMPERILNNTAGGTRLPQQRWMVLAGTPDNGFALAYLPNDDAIEISTRLFPGLSCDPLWSKLWVDPRTGRSHPVESCSVSPGRVAIPRPPCNHPNPDSTGACDWVLELRNTRSALSANSTREKDRSLMQVWAALEPDGATSAILARLFSPEGTPRPDEIVVSPAGSVYQKLPTVAREAEGGFFVVWQAEHLDGSLAGIFARRFDAQGRPRSKIFPVTLYTDHDQSDPTVTADPQGRIVMAWTSYGQDGEMGGIFARRFDKEGRPLGPEIPVNAYTRGHQGAPQIMADLAGRFVVAWQSAGQDGDGQGVYARLFDSEGRPRSTELQVSGGTAGDQILVALDVAPEGSFSVRWADYAAAGELRDLFEQWFDSDGRRLGELKGSR